MSVSTVLIAYMVFGDSVLYEYDYDQAYNLTLFNETIIFYVNEHDLGQQKSMKKHLLTVPCRVHKSGR